MNQGSRYDNIAAGFANLRDSFNTEKKYLDILISHLEVGANILDVGCGSGYPAASYLNDAGFKVTGLDASAELLKIAKNKFPEIRFMYGDVRTISFKQKFKAIVEWWCLFHLPKQDHAKMIKRFANWLNVGGALQLTTGTKKFEGTNNNMLNQELSFYSIDANDYEKLLKENNFKILLKEEDQPEHLEWIAKIEL